MFQGSLKIPFALGKPLRALIPENHKTPVSIQRHNCQQLNLLIFKRSLPSTYLKNSQRLPKGKGDPREASESEMGDRKLLI